MLKTIIKTQMLANDLKKNVEGASLIEYSILIGLIAAAVVLTIVSIGGKVTTAWTDLDAALP